jgi:hypothetical protein
MNFIIRILIIGILSYYLPVFFPWWSILVITFFTSLLYSENYFSQFLSGFIGVGTAWIFLLLSIDTSSNSILSSRIVDLLNISSVNYLIIYTSVIGGFVGGIGSILGKSFRDIIFKEKKTRNFKF